MTAFWSLTTPLAKDATNDAVGLLLAQIALVPDMLRRGEQSGINGCRSNDNAELAHRLAHSIQEGVAGVSH